MAREWGFWTRGKLQMLRDYLDAFTTASKSSQEILYFDLFAGQAENTERFTKEPIKGSPWVALSIEDAPFTRLRFFEIAKAASLRSGLASEFEGRDFQVIDQDCNEAIRDVLAELMPYNWAPSFAFLDPNGPHYSWTTIETLARFKEGRRYKVELWMLFPEPMFVRLLPVRGDEPRPTDIGKITAMFGTDQWESIYEARLKERLAPVEARSEYVNLMRWRLERELGYKWTHSFEVHNEGAQPIYQLVFATDHPAGNEIMTHLYSRALGEFPAMRQEALDRRSGMQRLFTVAADPGQYSYEAPRQPYGHRE